MAKNPEQASELLLQSAGIKKPPIPVANLVRDKNVEIRFGNLPAETSGFLFRDSGRTIIGVNSLHPATRQRFTLAHELGHLLLHPSKNFIDRHFSLYFRDDESTKGEIREEIEANQFAAGLLMPRDMIDQFIRGNPVDLEDEDLIRKLAAKFEVSSQALMFRLANLGFGSVHQTKRSS